MYSQIASWILFYGMYFSNCVFALDASLDRRSHLNWSSFDTIWNLLVSWSSSSLSELKEDELGDFLLSFFLLGFLLFFFICLGGERDWEEEDVRRRFLVFRFLRDLPLFGLEFRWKTLCSIFELWEPSYSFSWSLFSQCTILILTSAILYLPLCKGIKSWKRGG